ncbi:DUF3054 domain-containing protein [Paenarthrobacter sp. NPDC089322]|uniref:DUF3054 domain-containing protein n=1 Tax=Paenarthrobacter sp. NPDC089322 TaxID=3155065 RepID=UPI00341C95CA
MHTPTRTWILAAVGDLVLILVFAAIGRDAHARGDIVTGAFATAWPFLVGGALGWMIARAWRKPLAIRPSGLLIWLAAVGVGMLLRAVTGQTVVIPFVIVALLSLGTFLLGFRVVAGATLRTLAQRQRRD